MFKDTSMKNAIGNVPVRDNEAVVKSHKIPTFTSSRSSHGGECVLEVEQIPGFVLISL